MINLNQITKEEAAQLLEQANNNLKRTTERRPAQDQLLRIKLESSGKNWDEIHQELYLNSIRKDAYEESLIDLIIKLEQILGIEE